MAVAASTAPSFTKQAYQELRGYLSEEAAVAADSGVSPFDATQATLQAQPFVEGRKKECDMACAHGGSSSRRARSLFLRMTRPLAPSFRRSRVARGTPPNRRNVMDCILQLSAQGQLRFRNWNDSS